MEPIRFNIEASSLKARLRIVSAWIPNGVFLAGTWAPCASHLDPIHLVPGFHMPPIWFNRVPTWTSCPIHPEPIQFSSQSTWNRNCSGLVPKCIRRASTWGPYGSWRGYKWSPYDSTSKPHPERLGCTWFLYGFQMASSWLRHELHVHRIWTPSISCQDSTCLHSGPIWYPHKPHA